MDEPKRDKTDVDIEIIPEDVKFKLKDLLFHNGKISVFRLVVLLLVVVFILNSVATMTTAGMLELIQYSIGTILAVLLAWMLLGNNSFKKYFGD